MSEQKKHCTKVNCPMQYNTISPDCYDETCPYKTEIVCIGALYGWVITQNINTYIIHAQNAGGETFESKNIYEVLNHILLLSVLPIVPETV